MAGANTLRLSLRGHLVGPDVFDISMWFTPSGEATVPSDAATAAALLAEITGLSAFTTFTTALRAYWYTGDGLDTIAMYTYPSGGSHASAAVTAPLVLAGTSATRTYPNQVALVASLRSPFAGRQNRGRFFIPYLAQVGIGSGTAQLTSTQANTVAGQVATFLSAMNGHSFANIDDNALRPCVSTRGNSALITSVVVDTVLDTQRRRRNKVIPVGTATAAITIG